MTDLCRLIFWTLVDLMRARATLEAEIWVFTSKCGREACGIWPSCGEEWAAPRPATRLSFDLTQQCWNCREQGERTAFVSDCSSPALPGSSSYKRWSYPDETIVAG